MQHEEPIKKDEADMHKLQIIRGIELQLMVHIVHHVSNRHSISVRENAPQLFVMQSILQCKLVISLIQDMAMG